METRIDRLEQRVEQSERRLRRAKCRGRVTIPEAAAQFGMTLTSPSQPAAGGGAEERRESSRQRHLPLRAGDLFEEE